jgi:hypothetical protein
MSFKRIEIGGIYFMPEEHLRLPTERELAKIERMEHRRYTPAITIDLREEGRQTHTNGPALFRNVQP